MSPTPVTFATLADLVSGAKQSDNDYQRSIQKTDADQALADAAQKEADAAVAIVATDKVDQKTAAQQRNAVYRAALEFFSSQIIPGVDDPPAPVV